MPTHEKRKPFDNLGYEFARYLIVYKATGGTIKMNVAEMLSGKGETLGDDPGRAINRAFKKMLFSTNEPTDGESPTVIFYNRDYKRESSYQAKAGRWKKVDAALQNIKASHDGKESLKTSGISRTEVNCETYYLVYKLTDDDTGEVISITILAQWTQCSGSEDFGGIGGNSEAPAGRNNSCLNEGIENASILSNVTVTSEYEGEDILNTEEPLTKETNPKWVCMRGVGWILSSQEKGKIRLAAVGSNPGEDRWEWQSLAHGGISMTGFAIGGSVSASQESGTATVTPLIALMAINFDVTYAPAYNCPVINLIIPPYTFNYTAYASFNSKP